MTCRQRGDIPREMKIHILIITFMIEDSHPVVSPNACRLYFKCTFSRERSCAAKKQVQQRDAGEPPMFLVTYLNEHTCQQPQAVPGTPNTAGSSPTTTSRQRQSSSSPPAEMLDLTMNGAGLFSRLLLPHAVGGGGSAAEEEAAIVTCLAAVISGGGAAAAPPPLIWPTSAPEAAFVASAAGHSPSAADESVADEAAAAQMADMDYCFGQYDQSTFGAAAAADHRVLIGDDGDVQRIVAARIADTMWPRYTRDTSAWETAGTSSMRGSID